MNKWALIGLGFISQKHLDAIHNVGDELIMACDIEKQKQKKVGKEVEFFTNYLDMFTSPKFKDVDNVAICTPNYLHNVMMQDALHFGKKVLCEKPPLIRRMDIDYYDTTKRAYTVLQLRHNPELIKLKEKIHEESLEDKHFDVKMNVEIHRDEPYFKSWKADETKSGGLLFNIGIHYFDLLSWIFGDPKETTVYKLVANEGSGKIVFKKAIVEWVVSIAAPMDNQTRFIEVNGERIDLTRNFENLHTKVYEEFNQNKGITIAEASRTIALVSKLCS